MEERRLGAEEQAAESAVGFFGDSAPLHRPHDGQQEYQLEGRCVAAVSTSSARGRRIGIMAGMGFVGCEKGGAVSHEKQQGVKIPLGNSAPLSTSANWFYYTQLFPC